MIVVAFSCVILGELNEELVALHSSNVFPAVSMELAHYIRKNLSI